MIEELRSARRSKGWSQRTLAERIGVSSQAIKRLEGGVGSVETLIAVMSAVEFSLTGLGPGSTLPEQIRARRRQRGLSVAKIASRAGLSRATVASLEAGGGSVSSLLALLTVLAPNARRRAPERSYWGQGDKLDRDSRFTPPEFMAAIYRAFGDIDLDPCAHVMSPVVARRKILLSEGGDGFVEDWSGRLAFVNPPFSSQLQWLRRAHEQWSLGNVDTIVCLTPVRTCSSWFHETLSSVADIYFLKGRVRFLDPRGGAQQTPFSLMVVMLGATEEQKALFAQELDGSWMGKTLQVSA